MPHFNSWLCSKRLIKCLATKLTIQEGDVMEKAEARTISERQTSFRAAKKADGFVEVTMWLEGETVEKVAALATASGHTKGEVVDGIIKSFKVDNKLIRLKI